MAAAVPSGRPEGPTPSADGKIHFKLIIQNDEFKTIGHRNHFGTMSLTDCKKIKIFA
jgi:hypothetical protein